MKLVLDEEKQECKLLHIKIPGQENATLYSSGMRVTKYEDGTMPSVHVRSAAGEGESPRESLQLTSTAGTSCWRFRVLHGAGRKVTKRADGITVETFPDGHNVQRNPDGIIIETFPDGSHVLRLPQSARPTQALPFIRPACEPFVCLCFCRSSARVAQGPPDCVVCSRTCELLYVLLVRTQGADTPGWDGHRETARRDQVVGAG